MNSELWSTIQFAKLVPFSLRGVLIATLAGGALAPFSIGAGQASPQRLRLSVARPTLYPGDVAQLRVELLDGAYRPVANDRDRAVTFSVSPAGQGSPGTGVISPLSITLRTGARSDTGAAFRAQGVGTLFIQAASEGLVSAQTLVVILARRASRAAPSLHLANYNPNSSVELVQGQAVHLMPHGVQHVSANGVSPAEFQTLLDSALSPGDHLQILVQSFPGVHVRYNGNEQLGGVVVVISEDNAVSGRIELLSDAPGTVHVVARVLPHGLPDRAVVQFELPRPARVQLEKPWDTIRVHQTIPLTVKLADQDRVPLKSIAGTWRVRLSSPTDPAAMTFDPDSMAFSPERVTGRSTLLMRRSPAADQVRVIAEDPTGNLEVGDVMLTVLGRETPWILILIAGLGGVLGGVARDVYRKQTNQLLPSWSAGYLHLGLVGNALFSFLFGYIVYLAARLGLVAASSATSAVAETRTVGFFFGVLGGVGGIVVLDRLLDRVFPGRTTGERRVAGR